MSGIFPPLPVPYMEKSATLDQAAPVQNTWYTILGTTSHCIVKDCIIKVEVANETLECRVTIDGIGAIVGSQAAVAGTVYYPSFRTSETGIYMVFSTNAADIDERDFVFMGRSIKIEVRKTTATGAGNLKGSASHWHF